MKISPAGLELIKRFEGFRAAPYRDAVGVWTIGYGSTRYLDGRTVKANDRSITVDEAEELLRAKCDIVFGPGIDTLVTVPLDQSEYDALVSFAYNVGLANLGSSSLLRYLNFGDRQRAADEFPKWCHAGGKKLTGLVRRREAERRMFLGVA